MKYLSSDVTLGSVTKDDLARVIKILDGEKKYSGFISRITKDFNQSQDKGIPVAMQAFFVDEKEEDVGFCVISISPIKMKEWEKTFKEESWVKKDFQINISSFELMYLYVKPYFRAKGFGSRLFNQVLNYAKKTNIKAIYAFVSDTNKNSFNFYKKHGASVMYSTSDEKQSNLSAFLMWKVT